VTDNGSPPPTDPTTAPASADALTPNAPGLSNASPAVIDAILSSPELPSVLLISPGSSPTGRLLRAPTYLDQTEAVIPLRTMAARLADYPEASRIQDSILIHVDYSKIEQRIFFHYARYHATDQLLLRWKLERQCRELSVTLQKLAHAGSLSADAMRRTAHSLQTMKKSIGRIRYRLRYLRRGSRKSPKPTRR
jgi:hypothetical protein